MDEKFIEQIFDKYSHYDDNEFDDIKIKKMFFDDFKLSIQNVKNVYKSKIRDWIDAQRELKDKDLDTLLIAMEAMYNLIDKGESE